MERRGEQIRGGGRKGKGEMRKGKRGVGIGERRVEGLFLEYCGSKEQMRGDMGVRRKLGHNRTSRNIARREGGRRMEEQTKRKTRVEDNTSKEGEQEGKEQRRDNYSNR